MHNTWFLTFTERKDNQTSNKLNTIAIPLAATPLCMVANIVLALSLGGDIPPNLIYITISSHETLLYTLHYCFLRPCRGLHTYKQLCFAPLICIVHFSVCPTQLVAVFVQYRYLRHWLVFMSFLFTLSDVAHFVTARSFSP